MTHEVKICGTTSEMDLTAAANARADSIGLICQPPGRRTTGQTVDVERAVRLAASAKRHNLKSVLLPHSTHILEVLAMTETIEPDRVQLGENEDPMLARALHGLSKRPEIAQVIHVSDVMQPEQIEQFMSYCVPYVDIVHIDTAGENPGGNGMTHDWTISREIADRAHAAGSPVMLAGGLTPRNVLEAIETVRPDGVDVQSGIKTKVGTHNPRLVNEFVQNAGFAFRALRMGSDEAL
jgi:phosphoribosylanthranilate isomerase